MFGMLVLIIVGVILITVLYIVGTVIQRRNNQDDDYDEEEDEDEGNERNYKPKLQTTYEPIVPQPPDYSQPTEYQPRPQQRWNIPGPPAVPARDDHVVNFDRRQRPVTPNHYRPPTPQNQRPPTPMGVQQLENERSFKEFNELTDDEKEGIIDLNQCSVDVLRSKINPLLDLIKSKGDGSVVDHVIAYFKKSNDTQLTSSDKVVRKSFKIKNKKSNTCRFARMRITPLDSDFYRLTFKDYTPYVEEHVPKFDVFRQEIGNDRSHWEPVDAALYHNSHVIGVKQLSVLVPGRKD